MDSVFFPFFFFINFYSYSNTSFPNVYVSNSISSFSTEQKEYSNAYIYIYTLHSFHRQIFRLNIRDSQRFLFFFFFFGRDNLIIQFSPFFSPLSRDYWRKISKINERTSSPDRRTIRFFFFFLEFITGHDRYRLTRTLIFVITRNNVIIILPPLVRHVDFHEVECYE